MGFLRGARDAWMSNRDSEKAHGNKEDESPSRRSDWQMEDARGDEVSVPAIRHVGPTLESDPEYLGLVGSAGPTPEAQIAEQAGIAGTDVRRVVRTEADPLTGSTRKLGAPEPLKTRLPGDTSSDPHTNVGPDNATTVQHRGERKRRLA